ncbi:hypothetical protein Nepgr_030438 [Nepenthes gracilis]|uniref:Uncharacterized protein n=1 Tax=Nepenthes gracilis TaxID=150966 RepID=A0AAD3TEK5_NEPGR|nr:hypothetical protein Nepgr_030438 [Nepenthes gracilis]
MGDKFGRTKTFQLEADRVSRMAMIVGYTHLGHPIKALNLLVDEWWVGIVPNSVTPISILSASTPLGHLKMGKTAHCLGAATASSLMDTQGNIDQAWYCLSQAINADRANVTLRYHCASRYMEIGNYETAGSPLKLQFESNDANSKIIGSIPPLEMSTICWACWMMSRSSRILNPFEEKENVCLRM